MKKSDIKNGMHVITRDGTEYVIISGIYAPKQGDNLCCHDTIDEATDEDFLYDIDEVYVPNYYCWTLESALESRNKNDFTRLWKRGVRKMTKAEIEAELGYEIEIVED